MKVLLDNLLIMFVLLVLQHIIKAYVLIRFLLRIEMPRLDRSILM